MRDEDEDSIEVKGKKRERWRMRRGYIRFAPLQIPFLT
jgi:hypothetical protein